MGFLKEKIIFPLVAIILLMGLLGPYIVKISHALYEHEELHCVTQGKLHIHSVELDCDFDHYHHSNFFYPEFDYPEFFEASLISEAIINNYFFLSKYQQLHFVLRGPPTC